MCAAASRRLSAPQAAPGSPGSAELRGTVRKSPRPRGLQRWRARGVPCPAGRGRSPPRGSVSKKSPFGAGVFPGCKARGGGVLLAAVGRQAARNSPLATAAGGRGAPARALLPPHRPPAGRAPRRRRPRGTPRALRSVLQHHGQRLQHRRQRPAARRTAPRPFSTADSTAPTPRPRPRPPPEHGGPRTGLVGTPLRPGTWGETGRASLFHRARKGHGLRAVHRASGSRALAASSTALAING